MPAANVWVEGQDVGKAVDGVNAGQAELGVQEARMDVVWVVSFEELPDQLLPVRPFDCRLVCLSRQEALFVSNEEVGLRRYEAGVGVEEP